MISKEPAPRWKLKEQRPHWHESRLISLTLYWQNQHNGEIRVVRLDGPDIGYITQFVTHQKALRVP